MSIVRNKCIKNNILIIGHPGTGKTTLVEAYAIYNNLNNIFVVECAKLIQNTELRGSFEEKIVELIKFAKKMQLELFFDEIHTLIDLGKSLGGISITDILKPYLLDSNIHFIGATTKAEVMLLMGDSAFKRRFSIVSLGEPSIEELIAIKNNFERNIIKNKIFSDELTVRVIEDLNKKLQNNYFPDKLVDFMDYVFAYHITMNINLCDELCLELLEEYINDQKLE